MTTGFALQRTMACPLTGLAVQSRNPFFEKS